MTRFVLIRHAKSDRPPGLSDLDRPLADRGSADADLLGRFLARAIDEPGAILSSPAARARDTADRVVASAGWQTAVAVDERLYYGGVRDLIDLLGAQRRSPILAFGHEPVWSAAVATLAGGGAFTMATATAACLEGEPAPGGATLLWMVNPAILGGGRR